jgi:platelet-activating factor acetylhydrolase
VADKRTRAKKDRHGGGRTGGADGEGDPVCDEEREKWQNHLDHTDEELRKGYHHVVCL